MRTIGLLACLSLSGALAPAQSPSDPLSAGIKGIYNISKNDVVRAAAKMPEENYAFKPTPEVRSFGQIVGPLIAGALLGAGWTTDHIMIVIACGGLIASVFVVLFNAWFVKWDVGQIATESTSSAKLPLSV